MKVLFSWLKEYADFAGTPQEAAEFLTRHSYETAVAEDRGGDAVLDADVLANRAADSLSHVGIARELAAIADVAFRTPAVDVREGKTNAVDRIGVRIEHRGGCSRYIARVVEGVSTGSSPKWLKDRLEVLGQRSINNVVDALNYVMLEGGQPLHAFDLDRLAGGDGVKEMTVRSAGVGERMTMLDGQELKLAPSMTVIADSEGPLALAGIKGGNRAGVTEKTTAIVIESAAFDPVSVRRAARAVGLRTEASRRFEAGLDTVRPRGAVDRAAQMVAEVAGGTVARGVVDVGNARGSAGLPISFDINDVLSLTGMPVTQKEAESILRRLGFDVRAERDVMVVTPPSFRRDVSDAPDVIEEIARIVGYDRVPAMPPLAHLAPPSREHGFWIQRLMMEMMVGMGFAEARTHSFVGESDGEGLVEIENPMSRDLQYLRSSLLSGLAPAAAENIKHRNDVRLFEIGDVFDRRDGEEPRERTMIAAIAARRSRGKDAPFFEIKGVVEALTERLGITGVQFADSAKEPLRGSALWSAGRWAEIRADGAVVGTVGELDGRAALDLPPQSSAFEIDVAALTALAQEVRRYSEFSRFPAIVRDIAILVPAEAKVSYVLNAIESAGAQWVNDVHLFDWFEDAGDDRKSLAFRIVYQSGERTLTDAEVGVEHKKIERAVRDQGWEVR